MKKTKKKAFTLTELLVVVVIIGVLTAVVLPKFNKVLESFRTAEAEHILELVRNEQEARCTLGKHYTTEPSQLSSLPTTESKHFSYTLGTSGMTAVRTGSEYTLQMPSYDDGRICCDDCEGLNKNYISCDALRQKPDYIAGGSCSAVCVKEPYEEPCPNGQAGKISYTVNDRCEYVVNNTCEACTKTPYEENCPVGQTGKIFYTVNEQCEYEVNNTCEACTKTAYEEDCPAGQTGKIFYTVNNRCEYVVNNTCKNLTKYLSYVNQCIKYQYNQGEGIDSLRSSCSRTSFVQVNNCLVEYDAIWQYHPDVQIGLPSGCTPGQPCESCEVNTRYVARGMDDVYCGFFHSGASSHDSNGDTICVSASVFVCLESDTPPRNSQKSCRLQLDGSTGSGGGGGAQIFQP